MTITLNDTVRIQKDRAYLKYSKLYVIFMNEIRT